MRLIVVDLWCFGAVVAKAMPSYRRTAVDGKGTVDSESLPIPFDAAALQSLVIEEPWARWAPAPIWRT